MGDIKRWKRRRGNCKQCGKPWRYSGEADKCLGCGHKPKRAGTAPEPDGVSVVRADGVSAVRVAALTPEPCKCHAPDACTYAQRCLQREPSTVLDEMTQAMQEGKV